MEINYTGFARLARDWPRLSENERIIYTVYVLRGNVDLAAMRDRLNEACGTDKRLTLEETQAVRFVVEQLARLL